MQTYIVASPVIDMRLKPNSRSEVVSQTFFSEEARILEETNGWCKIKTLVDGYQGWTNNKEAFIPKAQVSSEEAVWINRLRAHVYAEPDTIYGPLITLPYECKLHTIKTPQSGDRWIEVLLPDGSQGYVQSGDIATQHPIYSAEELCRFSLSFLGIPYTWGGRTSFGYDCSGFVQMLYRHRNMTLPRDSKDQVNWTESKDAPIEELKPGDLIFFGNANKQIKHVGMWLGNDQFIHTCAVTENMPYVRISSIHDPAWNGSGYYPHSCGKNTLHCSSQI